MKAFVINGSPRRNWNTDRAVDKAFEGLKDSGFEVEKINLYDYTFKGCTSCFACKLKDAKTNGVCAMKDELRPVLEKLREADAVILGSPVYFSEPTGQVRSFIERWLFPIYSYYYVDGKPRVCRDKVIPCGMIYTMNVPEEGLSAWGYDKHLATTPSNLEAVMGYSETLFICNTYQFRDYSRYDLNLFSEEEKRSYRDSHFETDLKNAYELGCRIAAKAKECSQ